MFETPSLSTHSKEFNEDSNGNNGSTNTNTAAGHCPSCSTGVALQKGHSRTRSPRRSATGGRWGAGYSNSSSSGGGGDNGDDDSSSPSFHPPHRRHDKRQGKRSESPSRRARDASKVAAAVDAAAAAGKTQARRAASLLYSSLRFAAAVRSETLPPGERALREVLLYM